MYLEIFQRKNFKFINYSKTTTKEKENPGFPVRNGVERNKIECRKVS